MSLRRSGAAMFCFAMLLVAVGCGNAGRDANAGAPPPLKVEQASDPNVFQVDHPAQFPLVAVVEHFEAAQLKATGTVTPDISRNVPVISVATDLTVWTNGQHLWCSRHGERHTPSCPRVGQHVTIRPLTQGL